MNYPAFPESVLLLLCAAARCAGRLVKEEQLVFVTQGGGLPNLTILS